MSFDSVDRRQFLRFIGGNSLAIGLTPLIASQLTSCTTSPDSSISGIKPTRQDDLVLASGLKYSVLASWGDRLNPKGERFGFNNDFTSFIPMENKKDEAYLWVNHESVIPEFIHNKPYSQLTHSPAEIIKEQEMVGGSILHIKKDAGAWQVVANSSKNRRLHGRTQIPFSNDARIQGHKVATGTIANCSGGQTPWGTFLSSEENYDDFYGEAYLENGQRKLHYKRKVGWHKQFPLPPEHYGWIVEIDPKTGRAEKQVNLGRAPHEGATVALSKNKHTVVYMGEDRPGGFIYKYVSQPGARFDIGQLYAADTIRGRWLALDRSTDKRLAEKFKSQLDILTYAHQAAETVNATPQDRPEGIAIRPGSTEVFIALTKNPNNGNHYGSLLKISESGDFDSLKFKASTWVSGGLKSGMACPDNVCFDNKGHLWVTVDISEKQINNPIYRTFGNNGLFYIATRGPKAGIPVQVASAPVDAELTGPSFSPDYKTLFLSVQHPGSMTRKNLANPTSHWPHGGKGLAKPSVVAIQGPLLDQLTS